MVGSRAIRINWASRKPEHPSANEPGSENNRGETFYGTRGGGVGGRGDYSDRTVKAQNYKAISKQASPTNCTVYVGNVTANISGF